jgi:hypothetical protein
MASDEISKLLNEYFTQTKIDTYIKLSDKTIITFKNGKEIIDKER